MSITRWKTWWYVCTHVPTRRTWEKEFTSDHIPSSTLVYPANPYGITRQQFEDTIEKWNEVNPTVWQYKELL